MSTHAPRQGKPGVSYTYHHTSWGPVTLQADRNGIVRITSDAEALVADRLGLPEVPKRSTAKT